MCGAFNLEDDIIGYLKSYGYLFDLDDEAELKPGDFFPNGNSLILRGKESPKAEAMRWYYALGDGKTNVFNCRSESIFEKKMFSTSITNRRCIIPVSHYYEWMGEKGKKEKYEIFDKNDDPFFLGGIFNRFKVKDEVFEGFSIITKESVGEVKEIHNRMPIVIDIKNISNWLDNNTDLRIIRNMMMEEVLLKTKLSL